MAIQENIELEWRGGNLEIAGVTEIGDERDYLQTLKQGDESDYFKFVTRSPNGYRNLRDSGLLILPSPSLLTAYKNRVTQKPGFHNHISRWIAEEAEALKISTEEKTCDILIDEMTIQKNTKLECRGGNLEMVGFYRKRPIKETIYKHLSKMMKETIFSS